MADWIAFGLIVTGLLFSFNTLYGFWAVFRLPRWTRYLDGVWGFLLITAGILWHWTVYV